MNKLLKSLKAREIYLLIASFLLLLLFGVGILLSSTYNLTKDFRSYCLILSKKGKWIDKIYWSEL